MKVRCIQLSQRFQRIAEDLHKVMRNILSETFTSLTCLVIDCPGFQLSQYHKIGKLSFLNHLTVENMTSQVRGLLVRKKPKTIIYNPWKFFRSFCWPRKNVSKSTAFNTRCSKTCSLRNMFIHE